MNRLLTSVFVPRHTGEMVCPDLRVKAVLFLFVFVRITFISAALLIGFWFLTQLVHAGAVAQVQTGGVAYLAYVGGFVFGAETARFSKVRLESLTSRA
jgi:hypothetical protein